MRMVISKRNESCKLPSCKKLIRKGDMMRWLGPRQGGMHPECGVKDDAMKAMKKKPAPPKWKAPLPTDKALTSRQTRPCQFCDRPVYEGGEMRSLSPGEGFVHETCLRRQKRERAIVWEAERAAKKARDGTGEQSAGASRLPWD